MKTVNTVQSLREVIKQWRLKGDVIAFVPTMGNLHAGHIKLVAEARKNADRVIASVFVNPTQFGAGEDFNCYPRTVTQDTQKLLLAGADLLFLPAMEEIYQADSCVVVSIPGLSDRHCGASRPGHFDGVATIVTKLFNMVQPDLSFFGKKDFQQLLLIKTLVRDLNVPVEILGIETEREEDGLAMSSRNSFLSEQERLIAPELYQTLCWARDTIVLGGLSLDIIEGQSIERLVVRGFKVDYFSICCSQDLRPATANDKALVILVAAQLGSPRLIDNICFSRESC